MNQEKIWRHFQGTGSDSFASSHPRLRYLAARAMKSAGKKGGCVLNIGVGDGYFEEQAIMHGMEVFSLDPDAEAISRVCKKGAKGIVGAIEALPFEPARFDVVVASEVLEHLGESQRASGIKEIARVLKPSGRFIGTVPYDEDLRLGETVCPCCGSVFHRWGHQASFTISAMQKELASCFEVEQIRRTAFVSYVDRGLAGKLKSALRVLLAKLGQQIASPNIYFAARKRFVSGD